jgi:hypothetical protein
VEPTGSSPLSGWESFYVIVGSSAAALTGLQFVVIVLGAEINALRSEPAARAFATPTVVHFCAVLLISAILSAPWHSISGAGMILAALGVAGVLYAGLVARRMVRQTDYRPVLEDWIWHCAIPLLAYAALLVGAGFVLNQHSTALFVVGGTALLLLFVGIHNAWDAVVFMALGQQTPEGKPREPDG